MNDEVASPPQLLLVDDKPENLVALTAILTGTGYRLFVATSGAEALRIALRERLTVILLDVVMPGMDGFEVTRHLKELERTREIPILFLTALATDVNHIYRAYEMGAVDYIIKPLDAEVVRRKVRVFVELVQQREQIKRQALALREADRREYDLKLAELRVANDRRYGKLVEGIDHSIGWTMDQNLRFTFLSRRAAENLGYAPEKLAEPDFFAKHLHPDERDHVLALFRAVLEGGHDLATNHRLMTGNGGAPWFHTVASVEHVAGSDAVELHGISVEVTELKEAEEDAQRTTHLREEFLAIVAHDLRTPLSSIRLGATLMVKTAERDIAPVVEKTAQRILRATDRMDRLIGDLLDLALIQAGRLTVEPETVDAEALVQESLELFRPLAAEKEIQLEGSAEPRLLLHADRDRLLQVISNVVGNGLKFTPPKGSVALRVRRSGSEALFSISDTGEGLSDQELSRMWSRLWQGKKPAKGGGLGLGLFIARGIVEAHGGRIWAESNPEDGATFHFTMPLAAEDRPAQ